MGNVRLKNRVSLKKEKMGGKVYGVSLESFPRVLIVRVSTKWSRPCWTGRRFRENVSRYGDVTLLKNLVMYEFSWGC